MVNEHKWQDIETAPQGVSVLVSWTTTGLPPDDCDIAHGHPDGRRLEAG